MWLPQMILWHMHPFSFKNQMQFTEEAYGFAIKIGVLPETREGAAWPSICIL